MVNTTQLLMYRISRITIGSQIRGHKFLITNMPNPHTSVEEMLKEFGEKFATDNRISKTGIWWRIPKRTGEAEIASPVEVENWLREKLLSL